MTLESTEPVDVLISGRKENSPNTLYLAPFESYELEVEEITSKGEKTRFIFEKWTVSARASLFENLQNIADSSEMQAIIRRIRPCCQL